MTPPEILLTAQRFSVVRKHYQDRAGHDHHREVIEHPGAVTILPLVRDQEVCLIANHRVAVGQTLIELPAGTLEPGEDPLETAHRELAEETGYRAGQIELLCRLWMSPGILCERMHVYVARDLTPGNTELDRGEAIETQVVAWSEALAMIRDGQIEDAKTVAALLYYEQFRRSHELKQ